MSGRYTAVVEQVSYRDEGVNSDKFYRAYALTNGTDHRVLFQWGKRGTRGQSQVHVCRTLDEASLLATSKIRDKERKGYGTLSKADGLTVMDVVGEDLLRIAGVNVDAMPTVVDTEDRGAVFAHFAIDVDRCRRLAFGTPAEQTEAVAVRNKLRDQLDFLRTETLKAEGQLDFVEDVLHMAMEGV